MGSAGGDTNSKTTFHPTFTVSNIRNAIPLTLNQTDDHYASWVDFFNIHICAYNVKDHIDEKAPRPADVDNATWERLDALVKQWIYNIISPDLRHSIMKVGASTLNLWKSLQDIFLNNKTTRVEARRNKPDPTVPHLTLLNNPTLLNLTKPLRLITTTMAVVNLVAVNADAVEGADVATTTVEDADAAVAGIHPRRYHGSGPAGILRFPGMLPLPISDSRSACWVHGLKTSKSACRKHLSPTIAA
ncbi:hypothetical protein L1887_06877 [Cichorium endivia]|nr:hypothetical protein L1887_06877 [Cichorium endivia]